MIRAQQAISAARLKAKVGRRIPVIIDRAAARGGTAKGRSQWDAPEIDGAVHVTSRRVLRAGDMGWACSGAQRKDGLFKFPLPLS